MTISFKEYSVCHRELPKLQETLDKSKKLVLESIALEDAIFAQKQVVSAKLKALDPDLVGAPRTASTSRVVRLAVSIFYDLKVIFSKLFGAFDSLQKDFTKLVFEEAHVKGMKKTLEKELIPDTEKKIAELKSKITQFEQNSMLFCYSRKKTFVVPETSIIKEAFFAALPFNSVFTGIWRWYRGY